MKQKQYGLRILFVIIGVLLIGIAIGMLRLSAFGSDPFTVMNLGFSGLLSWQFGTWQLLVNCVLFLFMLRKARDLIGFGTVFNMVCVGYIADALVWLYHKGFGEAVSLAFRIVLLIIAVGLFCFGVAFYMRGDMGISPYDAVGYLIERMTSQKTSFPLCTNCVGCDLCHGWISVQLENRNHLDNNWCGHDYHGILYRTACDILFGKGRNTDLRPFPKK